MSSNEIDTAFIESLALDAELNTPKPAERNIIKIATFFTEVSLPYLKKEVARICGVIPDDKDEAYFKANSLYLESRDVYSLNDYERTLVLRELPDDEILHLAANIHTSGNDVMQSLYLRFINNTAPPLEDMTMEQLVAASAISKWCTNTHIRVPDARMLNLRIRQEELLLPFKKLTKNFKGRIDQLQEIAGYLQWQTSNRPLTFIKDQHTSVKSLAPLFITGIGGTGKSTLVAKSVLNHLAKPGHQKMPFIYIDFDKSGFSIANIFSLAREGLRQLCVQFDAYETYFNQVKEVVEFEYGGNGKLVESRGSDRRYLYERVFNRQNTDLISKINVSIPLIFDSFEELQSRAKSTDIQNLFNFLHELMSYIPQLRPIFIGRSEVNFPEFEFKKIELPGFDELAAYGFLEEEGVKIAALRELLFKKLGGKPLRLKLAAGVVVKELQRNIPYEEIEKQGLFSKIDETLIDQELVIRNLEHIHARDQRVKDIAIPGILVRKITPDVIQKILAVPCGLGQINNATAKVLFDELTSESFLFTYTDSEITFRQELREDLYKLVMNNWKYNAAGIHDAAVEYYRNLTLPAEKAEFLYHSLMRGDDPSIIDKVYTDDMRPYIDRALLEFPFKAYVHFSRVLGLSIPADKLKNVDIIEWEEYMKLQVKEVLGNGDELQLRKLQNQFAERKGRSPSYIVCYEEAMVYVRLNDFAKAEEIIRSALENNKIDKEVIFNLSMLLAEIFEYRFEYGKASEILSQLTNRKELVSNTSLIQFWFKYELIHQRMSVEPLIDGLSSLGSTDVSYNVANTDGSINLVSIDIIVQHPDINFQYLPKPYDTLLGQFAADKDIRDKIGMKNLKEKTLFGFEFLKAYMAAGIPLCLSSEAFKNLYDKLRKQILNKTDLERFLKRNYNLYLKDVSLPGDFELNFHDVLKFIETHPATEKAIVFSDEKQFSGTAKTLQVEAFTENAEVNRCLEKLKLSLPENFVISDVIDNEGNQYVNLMLQGGGVHGFALLGYTYILEKMGIRFLHVAGSGTGSLHAAFLATADKSEKNKTERLLKSYAETDFFRFMDGSAFIRIILTSFKPWFGKRVVNSIFLFVFTYITFIVLAIFSYMFRWGAVLNILLMAYAVVIFPIVIAVLVHKLRRVNRGEGMNPGVKLHQWIKDILSTNDVYTTDDLRRKATAPVPGISVRGQEKNEWGEMKPDIAIVLWELVTYQKILYPQMSDLFRKPEAINLLHPADFIRASMSIPVYFNSYAIADIPNESEAVKSAWLQWLGVSYPPTTAYFTQLYMPLLPEEVFEEPERSIPVLPDFDVFTDNATHYKPDNSYDKGLPGFLIRLFNAKSYFYENKDSKVRKGYEKGACRISLYGFNMLDFSTTSSDKIRLFIEGATAATQFLIGFNWENYKREFYELHKKK